MHPADTRDLFLTHYCQPGCKPFQNIMRLPEADAFALAKRMADAHPDTTAFYRFADFDHYYPLRLQTDALLYAHFVRAGGKPRETHPLSFVLQGSDYLRRWFGSGAIYRMPLHAIASDVVSFTLGDSCAQYGKTGRITLLTKEQLLDQIAHAAGDLETALQALRGEYSYIEAQLWDDRVVFEQIAPTNE